MEQKTEKNIVILLRKKLCSELEEAGELSSQNDIRKSTEKNVLWYMYLQKNQQEEFIKKLKKRNTFVFSATDNGILINPGKKILNAYAKTMRKNDVLLNEEDFLDKKTYYEYRHILSLYKNHQSDYINTVAQYKNTITCIRAMDSENIFNWMKEERGRIAISLRKKEKLSLPIGVFFNLYMTLLV